MALSPARSPALASARYDVSGKALTEKTMPKVSPALQCVMGWNMQYLVSYTVLAIDRTGNQFTNNAHLGVQKIVETACTTVTYAAMLSVLFLAALMLAIQHTQDETSRSQQGKPARLAGREFQICGRLVSTRCRSLGPRPQCSVACTSLRAGVGAPRVWGLPPGDHRVDHPRPELRVEG